MRNPLQQQPFDLRVLDGFAEGSQNKQGPLAASRALVLRLAVAAAILAHRRAAARALPAAELVRTLAAELHQALA